MKLGVILIHMQIEFARMAKLGKQVLPPVINRWIARVIPVVIGSRARVKNHIHLQEYDQNSVEGKGLSPPPIFRLLAVSSSPKR